MRCEVIAVGTELLLGQIVDTNSSWIGERLALAGIDSLHQTKVGDNHDRIATCLRAALERSDAVLACGGLGPTQDDITRAAIAEVMGVELERDPDLVSVIRHMFESRGREMPASNELQADVPAGAQVIEQRRGTAPGLICPIGPVGPSGHSAQVVYAVPGVPHEMQEMVERAVIPDLQSRAGETSVILSRTLRTWGESESGLAERVAPRLEALDATGNPTLAFNASGIEGIKVRITAKAVDTAAAAALLDEEEAELRRLLGRLVFGVDAETMEHAVGRLLVDAGLTLGLAESVTGGIVASRCTDVPGCSSWFRGGIVSYDSAVKFDLLDVPDGPVVSEEAAAAMASGARKVLGAEVGLAVTGVAGPERQDGEPVGTVIFGVDIAGDVSTRRVRLPGDRDRVRQFAAISLVDLLRHRLLDRAEGT
ncbi:MAG: competence/damage-inducible protein A [Acidimicrobiales bacterium]